MAPDGTGVVKARKALALLGVVDGVAEHARLPAIARSGVRAAEAPVERGGLPFALPHLAAFLGDFLRGSPAGVGVAAPVGRRPQPNRVGPGPGPPGDALREGVAAGALDHPGSPAPLGLRCQEFGGAAVVVGGRADLQIRANEASAPKPDHALAADAHLCVSHRGASPQAQAALQAPAAAEPAYARSPATTMHTARSTSALATKPGSDREWRKDVIANPSPGRTTRRAP